MSLPPASLPPKSLPSLSRRAFIGTASAVAIGAPLAGLAPLRSLAQGSDPLKVKLGWSGTGICLVSVPAAEAKGFFVKHGVDVDIVKYGGNFDLALESLASGKIDASVNFVLRYLKPLEQGVKIRFTGALHGGCIRALAPTGTPIAGGDFTALRGKTIGVTSMAAPGKNLLSIQLHKVGVNPAKDVEWRVYPVDLLGEAISKGEIAAAVDADPGIYLVLRNSNGALTEFSGQQTGVYKDLTCCAIAVRDGFIDQNREATARLTRALTEAAQWVHENPDEAAEIFSAYTPIEKPILAEIIRSHQHEHHYGAPGVDLKKEIAVFTEDLKAVGVIKPRTDAVAFANRVVVDVLG